MLLYNKVSTRFMSFLSFIEIFLCNASIETIITEQAIYWESENYYPEDEGMIFLRNFRKYLPSYAPFVSCHYRENL
jgi:hypothetical protein